jgi:AmmeMemoRadiSam system protein A
MSPPLHNSSPEVAASELGRGVACKTTGHLPSTGTRFTQEFSPEERSLLLRLAHESISSALEKRELPLEISTPHFAEHRGAFTSLYLRGELRGCVGYVLPSSPLYRAVAETARAAAFEDNRFPPVNKEEASHLEIELSILSSPQPLRAEEIEVGRHGLLIAWHGRRGLLLPQVPIEHGWDRTTFLEQTCRKAGLPPDTWQKGATIEAFTAEVFGEKSEHCESVASDQSP